MEVRCTGCNKLFRVSDDKITGAGIKFACSRCGIAVKITSEQFEQYRLSAEAASLLASFQPKPPKSAAPAVPEPARPELEVWTSGDPAPGDNATHPDFDLSDPATAAAAMQQEEEHPPVFVMPDNPVAEPVKPTAKPAPAPVAVQASSALPPRPAPVRPQPEVKTAPKPRPAAPGPVRPASVPPSSSPRPKETDRSAPVFMQSRAQEATGNGKKAVVVVLAVVLLGAGGFFAKSFFGKSSSHSAIEMAKEVTPEGLHIMNASGGVDPVSGDLIISGVIENTTDTPRPAWYVVVDLFDAQSTTLMQAKLVSGKQFYTTRDMDILTKRGTNTQELKMKQLQEQGIVIPARGSVSFEIRVLEPPVGVANFNAALQPFDPVKLYKEMSEAQK